MKKYHINKDEILARLNKKFFYSSELQKVKWGNNEQGLALCCFHNDRNPSLSINAGSGLFFCHGCGVMGDIFTFYQKKYGVDFKTALKELGRQAGL